VSDTFLVSLWLYEHKYFIVLLWHTSVIPVFVFLLLAITEIRVNLCRKVSFLSGSHYQSRSVGQG